MGILGIFAYGAKSCGAISEGVYDVLYITPFYFLLPWFDAPIVLAFILGGFIYPRVRRYHRLIWIVAIAVGIIAPLATTLAATRASFTCQPI